MTVRHVLLDADGVLQHIPGGWYAAMEPFLGDRTRQFLHETWSEELPMLAGEGDYLPVLAAGLERYGVDHSAETVFAAVWHRIEVLEESMRLVDGLRAAGYGVHLGTNQEHRRGAYMRSELGFDALFDVSCYSYDLGVAKPDPAFFLEAARRIGTSPDAILFVDDTERNVIGARAAGMRAVHWSSERGMDVLLADLATHDVVVG